jgi:hypothetical protein
MTFWMIKIACNWSGRAAEKTGKIFYVLLMENIKISFLEYAGQIFKKVGHKYFITAFDSVRANPIAHANGIAPTVHTSMYIRIRTGTGIGIL